MASVCFRGAHHKLDFSEKAESSRDGNEDGEGARRHCKTGPLLPAEEIPWASTDTDMSSVILQSSAALFPSSTPYCWRFYVFMHRDLSS